MMSLPNVRLLLVEDDPKECAAYEEYVRNFKYIDLIGVTGSVSEAVRLTTELRPNAIILDLQLEEGNGIDFFYRLKHGEMNCNPFLVVSTTTENRAISASLTSEGVGHVCVKTKPNYSVKEPINIIRRTRKFLHYGMETKSNFDGIRRTRNLENPPLNEWEVQERIHQEFLKLGANTHLDGYRYAEKILKEMILKNIHIMAEIYKMIRLEEHKSDKAIDQALNTFINYIWQNADPEVLVREYTESYSLDRGSPTPKKFLSFYANKIKRMKRTI